jgi:hypothetical protein
MAEQSKKRYELTRNANGHQVGETFTKQEAEQHGFEDGDLRELTTDRQVKSSDTTKR